MKVFLLPNKIEICNIFVCITEELITSIILWIGVYFTVMNIIKNMTALCKIRDSR